MSGWASKKIVVMIKIKTIQRGIMAAIAGDVIGSAYEFNPVKTMGFSMFTADTTFTDETVLTLCVAQWLLEDASHSPEVLIRTLRTVGNKFPYCGYGGPFMRWLHTEDAKPYNTEGNGAARRVSPVAFYAKSMDEALSLAKVSAEVTHINPVAVRGAQAVAAAIFLAREEMTKDEIRRYVEENFGYDLHRTVDEIRPDYMFYAKCDRTVPEAMLCYLESNTFEEAVRKCVSLGGDADTMASICGGLCGATAGMEVPDDMVLRCYCMVDIKLQEIVDRFSDLY